MGYSKILFVDKDKTLDLSEFMCPICHDVVEEPVTADPCNHTFCSKCIRPMWEGSKWSKTIYTICSCPMDGQKIVTFKMPERAFMDKLKGLELVCPCGGCTSTTELGKLHQHMLVCPFNEDQLVKCVRVNGCNLAMKRKEFTSHDCIQYLRRELQVTQDQLNQAALQFWASQPQPGPPPMRWGEFVQGVIMILVIVISIRLMYY